MAATQLVTLPVLCRPVYRRLRSWRLHHRETRRMNSVGCVLLSVLVSALLALGCLLLLALALLNLELSALFAVVSALVMQLVVLSGDLGLSDFAVAAAAGTAYTLVW